MFNLLQNFDPFVVSFIELAVCCLLVLILFRIAGKTGIFIYLAVAIIGANLQVLKLSFFNFFDKPVALGTSLFATIFFCTDLLSEHYGKKVAQKAVWVGFAAFFVWTIITQITLGYAPLTTNQAGEEFTWALGTHPALENLFTLIPSFFVASIVSYFVSQFVDIHLYEWIKKKSKGRFLFLRNNFSTMTSSLVDNTLFSFLAFIVFNPEPLPWPTLIFTFILGTYLLRVFYSLFDTPFVYLSYYFLPNELRKQKRNQQ